MEYDVANTSNRCGKSWGEVACVAIAFIVLSAFLVEAMTQWDPLHNTTFGGDPAFYLWSLKWWPHALSSMHNPFYAPIFYPFGQNLAWTTSAPTLALLAIPMTLLAGPVFALNVINAMALAANGTLAYLIGKKLDCKRLYACVCALLFYFSSYTWGQLLGHTSISTSVFAMALIYLTLLRVRTRISRIKYLIIAALLLALQFGTSVEVYATLIFFAGIAFIIFLLSFGWKAAGVEMVYIASDLVAAVCGSLLIISPYLYEMFTHYESNFQNISYFVADPVNYVVPTQTNWILGSAFKTVSAKFTGNVSEQGVYLGLPMLALLVMAGREFYSNVLNRALLISLVVVALCSLGPHLSLLGIPTIWLPWSWIEKLPLIGEALPSRFGLYSSLLAAILVGRILTVVPKWDVKVLAVASVCLVLPNLSVYWSPEVPQSSFFSGGTYKSVIPKGSKVLVLPTYEHGGYQPALWQAQSDFWFALTDSPVPAYTNIRKKYSALFSRDGNQSAYGYELLKYIKDTGTQFVLTDNNASDGLTRAFHNLHLPYRQYGSVRVSEISGTTVDYDMAKLRASSIGVVCDSLVELAKIGSEYVSQGSPLSSLTPSKVANSEFEAQFGKPMPPESPGANWTTKGYWLGGRDDAIAVGMAPVSRWIAAGLYASFKAEAQEVYFPYPKVFHGEEQPEEPGQILVVLKHGVTLQTLCNQ